jgi:3-isopropylmalate/(R)-2-methylmalate dehydratase small subunit
MRTQHRVHVYGDNINTDLIFAGKYTYTLRDPQEIATHALEDLDTEFVKRVQAGDVIVAGKNWGNGSSREQAVTCLKWSGIRAIIAESFGGLYMRNCINQGIRPIILGGIRNTLQHGDMIELDDEANVLFVNQQALNIPALSPSVKAILDAGGLVPMLKTRFA